ncbi:glycosyltransferase [Patescibacteria group bacterium]|nr:glycosyltransferase [Patescibacteria group bacterium]MBU0777215.1 glycosyltransferase [Patescibacteria group bacterium]MBU0845910.1 glycosyltransferase [Patescibacteria group bacterium]MBU0922937.1 glycosyltransferase [Patescibacteria group bacterium]MBU1066214.1 glycosyltransferase [Patescibacteria group bacterium]
MTSYSFIIPSFNSAKDLMTCVRSLNSLKYNKRKYEIIIVDDGSTDQSTSQIKRLNIANLKIYKNPKQGAAAARNYGIEKAKKNILIFLDQDVSVKENLLNIYDSALKITGADAVQGNIWKQLINTELTKTHATWRKIVFINKVNDHDGFIKTIVTRNVAIKKEVLNKILRKDGYIFDEKFKGTGGEDRELGYRINKLGFNIYLEPQAIVKHKDPDKLLGILIQKYKHARGDVKLGIGEKFYDISNFKRVVINPLGSGVPLYFSFLIWCFHIAGCEIERAKQKLIIISNGIFSRNHSPRGF